MTASKSPISVYRAPLSESSSRKYVIRVEGPSWGRGQEMTTRVMTLHRLIIMSTQMWKFYINRLTVNTKLLTKNNSVIKTFQQIVRDYSLRRVLITRPENPLAFLFFSRRWQCKSGHYFLFDFNKIMILLCAAQVSIVLFSFKHLDVILCFLNNTKKMESKF